jgi:hypothetical protein
MNEGRSWEKAYLDELKQAKFARSSGNEGMSRVCARRAAGIIIGEYFARNGIHETDPSAYARIKFLHSSPGESAEVLKIAEHLLQRVNRDHELPTEIDLIAETRQLALVLIPD